MDMGLVVVMGIVTVFICLICLIVIMKIMSLIIVSAKGNKKETAAVAQAPVQAVSLPTIDKSKLVAAIGVAIAEDMGTDASHIRIHSIRKI